MLLSLPLLHETSSMRDGYHGLKMTVFPNWKSYSRKKTLIYTNLWEIYFNCILQYILMVHRCKCGNCVLAFVVKPNECRCLCEPCKEKMLKENMHDRCLTEHPAFDIGCLKLWVLKLAGLSYKTQIKGC